MARPQDAKKNARRPETPDGVFRLGRIGVAFSRASPEKADR